MSPNYLDSEIGAGSANRVRANEREHIKSPSHLTIDHRGKPAPCFLGCWTSGFVPLNPGV